MSDCERFYALIYQHTRFALRGRPCFYEKSVLVKEQRLQHTEVCKIREGDMGYNKLSIKDNAYSVYRNEEEAAIAFAKAAASVTKAKGNEFVAMIVKTKPHKVNLDGAIVYEQRCLLTETLEGKPRHCIPQLLKLYLRGRQYKKYGASLSFIHTHPYLGKQSDEFSGDEGKSIRDILKGIVKMLCCRKNKKNLSNYLGDAQVPWLPGVDNMLLVSPISNKIYSCNADGPVKDSSRPKNYLSIAEYY